MFKTTIYRLFLALLLVLVPIAGAGQQNVDIKKPTRERVKDKDKSSPKDNKAQAKDKTSKDNKAQAKDKTSKDNTKDKAKESSPAKNDKNANAAADKSSSKKDTPKKDAPKKDDTKKDAPKKDDVKKDAPKKDDTKKDAPKASQLVSTPDDKTAAKQPVADTATKKPEPPKRPVKQPVNPDKVKYDGIDISSHQGNIKWAELKKNTALKFIYIKATEGGNFRDQMYAENFRNARKQGFKVGSYHFFRTTSGAKDQFVNFVKTVNREEQDLLPMVDIEERKNWSVQQFRDSVKVFLDLVEDYYGCKPLIYTGEKFFNDYLGIAFKHYPLFIAKYSNVAPKVGYPWILWQFSECGQFAAVKDNLVDMSRFNEGNSIKDLAYVPSKHTPKSSVMDAVNRKPAPASVTMTEQKQKPIPDQTKRQKEEEEKQAAKQKKTQERQKQAADNDAKKKAAADKAAADKKAAAEKRLAEKKAAEKKAAEKKAADKKAAEKKAAEEKAAEAKAKRKASAQQARANQQSKQGTTSKQSNLLHSTTSSKLAQTQRNDSIRNANLKGRKTNKSSADND